MSTTTPSAPARQTVTCQIIDVVDLSPSVLGVTLKGDPAAIDHLPGQYLELALDSHTWVPFSIASHRRGDGVIELHIQHRPERENSARLRRLLTLSGELDVRLPGGECVLDMTSTRPLLLIAAGTGFAQMKAIVEAVLEAQPRRGVFIWWAAREHDDLYAEQLASDWAARFDNVHFHAVTELELARPLAESPRIAHHQGRIDDVLERALPTLGFDDARVAVAECDVYLSGSPGMVYACVDVLEAHGVSAQRLFSDVFAYAPRPAK
ncbi:NAD(P)H-flavin reductase [Vreelandella malpeensis]|uniref:NAD(P)H-flavin reductase n=1 Tax=Vreelandella malpeensis TaxID=1172368 RepID=A0ABS8DVU3_9GAMM|nr:NAD(P)H-flavin reductase [Halomonas malpeensis]MCB8890462.1 NAD(P)H-flavin reductase [Halomonas malpeensis]